ncbi:hypothetical protein PRIPAC_90768 [Pristionchus pacificus]|uniref:DUF148 domain-containing protein n=1 Tax=Pristionchus pacificus TaxID=54126 RepID=A0A2A6CJA9_PRIPA|nr:hypothetical protein PRIPAC_90768 [Pristionchus pacificus]|eukprot:PDM78101.1 hypothetical protein PRIPAC_30486 [Pristionchus pacificus]
MRYSPYLLIFISSHYRMTRILIVLSSASLLISSFPFGGEFNGNQPSFPSYGGDFNGNKVDGIDGGFAPITSIGGGEGTFPGQGEINGGSGGFFGSFTASPSSPFHDIAFFFKLSAAAQEEFGKILMSGSTKAEIKTAITAWAGKYNVTSQVSSLIEKHKSLQTKFRDNISKAIGELPAALEKLAFIEDNDSLTIKETIEQTRESLKSITTPYLKSLVVNVIALGALYQ